MQNNPTLVFVHLNSKIPLYLKLNLSATSKLFSGQKIVLVHNQEKHPLRNSSISTFFYNGSKSSQNIEESLSHPKEFRNNFWFSSIARLDALNAYAEFSGEDVLHIESDVLLSADFPISKFSELKVGLAYPVVAPDRGVASTVYIANASSAKTLVDFAVERTLRNPASTDMEILADFFFKETGLVFRLPFAPASEEFFRRENMPQNMVDMRESQKFFGGIFDGNDAGVYLFGFDPRNSRGLSHLGTSIPGNYADITKWRFRFDNSREFVSVIGNEAPIPLFSLHASSKELLLFWKVTRNLMIRRGVERQSKTPRFTVNILVMAKLAIQKVLRILKLKK